MNEEPTPKKQSDKIIDEAINKAAAYELLATTHRVLVQEYAHNKDYLLRYQGRLCLNCNESYEPTDDVKNIRCKNCGQHPKLGMLT